ncbi:MAG: pyridoxamine 5'-phosphate oxidase family protein [Pseudomonadales bacterium]|nr:pyridoxamine 5'-phosphate oxidase family protein [Halioglobus sp.]MCP5123518.1 pyridoxamine 5'-phosphate oxidase family protein [Pseudomonadales bacterium]MCP5193644.1 pyridoxamine 5'-phosphate oxidase family protein [Pseudomonadales bacterium]
MAERFSSLQDRHIRFIAEQHLFFVGTAGREGYINVSPKGMDSFRVTSPTEVAWLNLTGSGNESAAHVAENGRMTIMFCSFGKQPLIMRLYGQATVVHPRDGDWPALLALFPAEPGARQIFRLTLDLVLTSCGYAVPRYELKSERPTLTRWTEQKGPDGIRQYWQEKNTLTLDGKPTGIFADIE